MGNDIDKFITEELSYFKPILDRKKRISDEQKNLWKKETVQERHKRISLEVYDLFGGKIQYGPFSGMHLEKAVWWGAADLGSQCLGFYEQEILDFLVHIKSNSFRTFINIGAGNGYYAVGMLSKDFVEKAICFEKDSYGRELIKCNWKKNGSLGRLSVFGKADVRTLLSLTEEDVEDAIVLVDIEGDEFDLFEPDVFSKLKKCTIVVEIHNWVDGFLNKYKNFLWLANDYFKISRISPRDRLTTNIPELRDFPDENRLLLISERRPCVMRFLKLTPYK